MDDRPLVSICILNHNYGRWVEEAVDSALAQTYERVEVVVVDDESDDDSVERLRRYGDRIRLVEQARAGQRGAANGALAEATGDIIHFLDADDRLRPATTAAVVDAFTTTTPRPVLVQFRLGTIDADGRTTGDVRPPRTGLLGRGELRDVVLRYRTWHSQLTSGCAFWADDLRSVGPVPLLEGEYHALDHYLISVTPLLGRIHALDLVGADYRVHDTSVSHRMPDEVTWPRRRIALTQLEHEQVRKVGARLGLDVPDSPDHAIDPAYLGWRLWSLRVDAATHPAPGDRRLRLGVRGAVASVRHPHFPLRHRLKRAAWFGAMAVVPDRWVMRVLEWYRPDGPTLPRAEA